MAIDPVKIDAALSKGAKGVKALKTISKLAKRKSIMTMAEPGMYQYPILLSNGIDVDAMTSIAKAYQLTYASSVVVAYSLNPIMYLQETKELTDFVKRFHSNSIIPSNLDTAASTLGIESLMELPEEEFNAVLESVKIDDSFTPDELTALGISAWDNTEDSVSMESLNNMYRPYERTKRILNEKLNDMKMANESLDDALNHLDDFAQKVDSNGAYSTSVPINGGTKISQKFDRDTGIQIAETIETKPAVSRNFTNGVVRNNQLEALEPTMVNVQILCHGKTGDRSEPVQFTQNLTLGIKAMPRVISSDLMIASMVEVCKNSNVIFKFLKWTKHEVKTLDFILGISASKEKALHKDAKNEVKLINQSRKRKKLNGVGKFLKNEVLPTLSIVITSYEAAKIQEACAVDLNDLKQAAKIMNKYYLLSFGIYDTEQNTMKVLFDCDADWSYTTIGTMRAGVNKTTDVMNQNAIYQLFGRR